MQPERDDEDQGEERFCQDGRRQQEKRRLQEEQRDRHLRAFEFDLTREPERLPSRRKTDDGGEKLRRRVAELREREVEQREEGARPDAYEIFRMTMGPAGEQVMVA